MQASAWLWRVRWAAPAPAVESAPAPPGAAWTVDAIVRPEEAAAPASDDLAASVAQMDRVRALLDATLEQTVRHLDRLHAFDAPGSPP